MTSSVVSILNSIDRLSPNELMGSERSFFEVVGDLIRAGEGPGDPSTNSVYLKSYGYG